MLPVFAASGSGVTFSLLQENTTGNTVAKVSKIVLILFMIFTVL